MSPEKPKKFNLPEDGSVNIQAFELNADKEAEELVLRTVMETDRVSEHLQLIPGEQLWRLNFGNEGSVYLKPFLQRTTYGNKTNESHNLYAVDIDNEGQVAGYGFSVRHSGTGDYLFPFVGGNRTMAGFSKQGLGMRRLVVLNEACKQVYGELLGSGTFIDTSPESPEIKAWERLVSAGLAGKSKTGYRFIK